MCIGMPMQVVEVAAGADRALAHGRGRSEVVDLRLVGSCSAGDWLLVFQGAARERIHAQRAAEIDAALDLLERGLLGQHVAEADPGFALPSAMSAAQVAALAGRRAGSSSPSAGHRPGRQHE